MNTDKILVGISSCLLGEEVRHNGSHKLHSYIVSTLGQYFDFRAFCPEMSIGLGVPRAPIRIVNIDEKIRVVGSKNPDVDVTDKLIESANQQRSWHKNLYAYIVKKDSPSCGMERVKVYKKDAPMRTGTGLYTQVLMENFPDLPVEEEGRLGDPCLRENFIKRVFIYKRWRDLEDEGIELKKITRFHAQHKLILYSHDQNLGRDLGKKLATIKSSEAEAFAVEYRSKLMQILRIPATTKNHVNVLQHIQGYLKKKLDSDDRQELSKLIDEYRTGLVPLIVPVTLLRHHFRKCPDPYIDDSYYMNPHPKELMLLNNL